MENYKIEIYVDDYVISALQEYIEDPDCEEEDRKWYNEVIHQYKEWNEHIVIVHTLKEYFDLLEKVHDYSDGQYSVYNEGTFIRVGD